MLTRAVLILVLVEDGLRVMTTYNNKGNLFYVLILVLVEDGLRALILKKMEYTIDARS